MSTSNWHPSASLEALKARAALNAQIRDFFQQLDVMEVETPLLNSVPVADPNIDPVEVHGTAGRDRLFLHTSPEYSMKRLLCAGSGDIYSLGKVFRAGEAGGRHNPEFTMLEWYRLGFDHFELMHEVADLLVELLGDFPQQSLSYRQAMIDYAQLDPFSATDQEVELKGIQLAGCDLQLKRDGWLDIIMSHQVEKQIPAHQFSFIHSYPASQAALAKITQDDEGHAIAERFEVYFQGLELANGYHELQNADEQRERFEAELAGTDRAVDERLLAAMSDRQLPACAGVAMGLDRLLMVKSAAESITQVLSFDFRNC